MLRRLLFAVFVLLLSGTLLAQPMRPSAFQSLAAVAPELVRLQNQFEQARPAGISLRIEEVSRKGTSGQDLDVRYHLYVKGAPEKVTFRQLGWPVDQGKPVAGINGITLNGAGQMICAGRTADQCHNGARLEVPVLFAMQKPLKGEPRRFLFVSKESELRIPVVIVPGPVEGMIGAAGLPPSASLPSLNWP
jgi:hypothetical protein